VSWAWDLSILGSEEFNAEAQRRRVQSEEYPEKREARGTNEMKKDALKVRGQRLRNE
jgi:hypothetical protein